MYIKSNKEVSDAEKLVLQLENLACPICAENVGVMLNKTQGVENDANIF